MQVCVYVCVRAYVCDCFVWHLLYLGKGIVHQFSRLTLGLQIAVMRCHTDPVKSLSSGDCTDPGNESQKYRVSSGVNPWPLALPASALVTWPPLIDNSLSWCFVVLRHQHQHTYTLDSCNLYSSIRYVILSHIANCKQPLSCRASDEWWASCLLVFTRKLITAMFVCLFVCFIDPQELVVVVWFTSEFVLRVWSAGCRSRYQQLVGRVQFLKRPLCIVGQWWC